MLKTHRCKNHRHFNVLIQVQIKIPATMPILSNAETHLAQALNKALPQTQCQRCGYAGCLPYAQAMAQGQAPANRCPPGGQAGLITLSAILGIEATQLDGSCGAVGPRTVAYIRPDLCIGCTKCIDVCPTDAIVGGPRKLHFVIAQFCTGCDLCLPPCPVDCIDLLPLQAHLLAAESWSDDHIATAKARYDQKSLRSIDRGVQQRETQQQVQQAAAPNSDIANLLEKARLKAAGRLAKNKDVKVIDEQ